MPEKRDCGKIAHGSLMPVVCLHKHEMISCSSGNVTVLHPCSIVGKIDRTKQGSVSSTVVHARYLVVM